MDPNQDPNQQPNQQFTPGNSVPPPPSGGSDQQQPAPQDQPQSEPQDQQSAQEEEKPAYVQGTDGPPAPGEATHPPGGYQAKAGETVQAGVGGGAVVQKAQGDDNQTPATTQAQPGTQAAPPPSQPQAAPPPQPQAPQPQQPTAPQQPPAGPQPQMDVNSVLQDEQNKLSGIFAGLNKKVLIIIVVAVLVPLLAAIVFLAFNGGNNGTSASAEQDQRLTNDIQILRTGIGNYFADNNRYPSLESKDVNGLTSNYLPSLFVDPRTEEPYVLTTDNPTDTDVQYKVGAVCGETSNLVTTNDTEHFAIRVNLSDSIYCIDNQ